MARSTKLVRLAPVLSIAAGLSACAAAPPRVAEPARTRAEAYERRAVELERLGDRRAALYFATRALVVRLADCGYDCPEVAYSFVQLGDLRLQNGQPEHAAQSYARALEVLSPHRATHGGWVGATSERLARACAESRRPPPGCGIHTRGAGSNPRGDAP